VTLSRRWLIQVSLAAKAARLAAAQNRATTILSATDSREIEVLASQIIPSSANSPGAREAGVIHFIDKALESFDRDKVEVYRKGLAATQARRVELFPSSQSIAELTNDQQIALLRAIEKTRFFETLRTHTVMGFLSDPRYGGNRGRIGWKHIGFENSHHFTPPFGYYDAEENR
jgi:gluconate 2-dehydrogenase gamma chain